MEKTPDYLQSGLKPRSSDVFSTDRVGRTKRYTSCSRSTAFAAPENPESRTPKLIMSDTNANLHDAITEGNVPELHTKILASEFVLLSTSQSEDSEDENIGALTAEIEDFEVLVAFTSEENAKNFVQEMGELFAEDESVDGILVEGAAMLEYLPEGYGLLLDPELENASIMDPRMTADILALQK